MVRRLSLLLALVATCAYGATSGDRFSNTVKVGDGAAGTKTIEFDTGGSPNAKISTDGTKVTISKPLETITVGNGTNYVELSSTSGIIRQGLVSGITGAGAGSGFLRQSASSGVNPGFSLEVLGTGVDNTLEFDAASSGRTTVGGADTLIAQINFQGFDGTNYEHAARIKAEIDETPGNNDMPGRLGFYTTPNGSSTSVERLRIDNAGVVNAYRLNSGARALDANCSSAFTSDAAICSNAQANLSIITGLNGSGSKLTIASSRGTIASPTIVSNDATPKAQIDFAMHDGTNFETGASIRAYLDGTPGNNDMPTALRFYTVADGSTSLTEAMRLDSNSKLDLSTGGSPGIRMPNGTSTFNWYEEGTWTPTIVFAGGTGTASVAVDRATFTRIGRQITVQVTCTITKGTGSGAMRLDGLPYTSNSSSNMLWVGNALTSGVGSLTNKFIVTYITAGSQSLRWAFSGSSSNDITALDVNSVTTWYLTITYWA